jgi:hypothetical protein
MIVNALRERAIKKKGTPKETKESETRHDIESRIRVEESRMRLSNEENLLWT